MTVSRDDVRRYWDERARDAAGTPQATTDDVWLRRLEVQKLVAEIQAVPGELSIADLGCGDGRTALAIAEAVPGARLIGVDFSPSMVATAKGMLDEDGSLADRVRFVEGDMLALNDAVGAETFDVVITDRSLINLPSWDDQRAALASIAAHIRPGGHYFAVENFMDGHETMNALRRSRGLPDIPLRWHNIFLDEPTFLAEADRSFDTIEVEDFTSTYYLVTRVVYSALCALEGVQPDYEHPIHEIAASLPPVGRFSPIRFVKMRRRPG